MMEQWSTKTRSITACRMETRHGNLGLYVAYDDGCEEFTFGASLKILKKTLDEVSVVRV